MCETNIANNEEKCRYIWLELIMRPGIVTYCDMPVKQKNV